jgi:hypothetical protein
MKLVTQQLFHSFLTFDFSRVESLPADNLDPLGKNLIYILYLDHLIQLKNPPSPQAIKEHLELYFYLPIRAGSWQKDQDLIILLLVLLLGRKEWKDQTHFYLGKLQQYMPKLLLESYFTQPAIKNYLHQLSDLKSQLLFISMLKGIYFTLLNDDLIAIKYLNDHDATHRGIAHYYLLLNALRQKQIDQVKSHYELLIKEPFYQTFVKPLASKVTTLINTYERPNFLQEIAKLNEPKEIDKYIINTFSKPIFDKMHDDTRKMIQSAFYITGRMTNLFLKGKIDDYSTFALPFVKAFELECYRLFKRDYLRYLQKENISAFQAVPQFLKNKGVEGLVVKQGNQYQYEDDQLSKFSIGQIPFIVGIPSHYLDPLNPLSQQITTVPIHPTFKQYWQKQMLKKPEFNHDHTIKEIALNTFVIKNIRNQIAHAEIITWAQLTEVVRLIFESGHIRRLVEMNA